MIENNIPPIDSPASLKKNFVNPFAILMIIVGFAIGAGAAIYFGGAQNPLGNLKKETASLINPQSAAEREPSAASLEKLARCLTQKGVNFYGAYWCPWCQRQKDSFGEASQYLPYVECIDESSGAMTETCEREKITGFPTWQFGDKKTTGLKTPSELSELSGCPL